MPRKMSLNLQPPITYLITGGKTTAATTTSSKEFLQILKLIEAAVAAGIGLIQIREKQVTTRVVYELALSAAAITRGSATGLLINDRADIAAAAGADGVHLTTSSLDAAVIRRHFGPDILIGVSTHSRAEARQARADDADFVVFGPVFEILSKQTYGAANGLDKLKEVALDLAPFPVLALGGVATENARDCFHAGAAGIAGISLFDQTRDLQSIVSLVHDSSR